MRRDDSPSDAGPVDGPIASTAKPSLTSTEGTVVSLNDGAHTGTTPPKPRRKQRVKPRDIDELAAWLSERDVAILRSVAAHQFLTVRHIQTLHFADHPPDASGRLARRTLARLRDHRLLGTLQRRIGGIRAGSVSRVHYLDGVGDQLLNGRSAQTARRRSRDPSSRFLNHRLAVADAHVALVAADRRDLFELVECAIEPASWRRLVGLGGTRLTLKADLYVEIAPTRGSDFVDPWFIEVDLGTEGIQTLLKKCRDYEAYRRTGIEQEHGGFPLVVWSMTHPNTEKADRRRLALREAIDRDRTLTPELFRIIAPDELVPLLQAGGAS